jgi:membrane-bound serine protease (ClpP class)
MDPVVLAVILLVAGLALALLEVFLPSGGLLTLLCVASLLGSVIVAGTHSIKLAAILLFVALASLPIVLLIAFKLLPKTPIGRRLILNAPDESTEASSASPPVSATTSGELAGLLGQQGVTITPLRPSGIVEIGNRRVSVVTHGDMLETGRKVKVVEIQGNYVVVEPLDNV